MKGVLDFFDVVSAAGFNIPAAEAIEKFYDKGLTKSFAWQDVLADEHATSFTVAKMMDMDLLADVKASLESALETGTTFREWSDKMIPALQAKGWWGRKAVVDPLTGQTVVAQLGSPSRLQTIFRTNMASAYAAGHWDMIEAQAEDAPFLLYDAIDDFRTRPAHKAWDGKVYPITDNFWKGHTPPCGWNCRCTVIQLDESDLEDLGLKPEKSKPTGTYDWTNPRTGQTFKIPNGVDPTFGQAAAKRIDNIIALAKEKAAALPDDLAAKAEAALKEIDKHLADKTPYVSTAIKAEQKKGQLGPVELLAKAKQEAAKTKQSVGLTKYKAQITAGKKPEPLAQSAFDALPQEAKLAIIQELETKSATLKANAEATTKVEMFKASTPDSKMGKAWASLTKQGKLEGLDAIQQAAALEAEVIVVQQAKALTDALSGYKAAILKGKVPSKTQAEAFAGSSPEVQAKILADIEKKKPKPEVEPVKLPGDDAIDWNPKPTPDTLSPELPEGQIAGDFMTQIGPQKGSNPGGLFQDTDSGQQWYIKFIPESKAKNEMLTAKLYELAGVESVDYRFVVLPDGREGLASKWIDGLTESRSALEALPAGVGEGFAVDAWLANWDVIGQGYDNMKLLKNRAVRVDTGGGLIYRAQGGEKGAAFGDKVGELDSLRDANTNPQAANIFGRLKPKQIEASVARVLLIQDDDILAQVMKYGPGDEDDRRELARKLIARKQDLFERYPNARPKQGIDKPTAPDKTIAVSASEQATIVDSRANGYALKVDGADVEDHSVVFSTFAEKKGPGMTRAAFKLTPEGMKKLDAMLSATQKPVVNFNEEELWAGIKLMLVGVNSRADKGGILEATSVERWAKMKPKLERIIRETELAKTKGIDPAHSDKLETALTNMKHWYKEGVAKLDGKTANDKAIKLEGWLGDEKETFPFFYSVAAKNTIEAKTREGFVNVQAEFHKGNATIIKRDKVQDAFMVKKFVQADLGDGVRLSYVPEYDGDDSFSIRGQVFLDVDEVSTAASSRLLQSIEKLGVEAVRTTDEELLDLYTHKIARLNAMRDAVKTKAVQSVEKLATIGERIMARLELIEKWTGIDITTRPEFNSYTGIRQAFGHGRTVQNRPDFDEFDFALFEKDHVIYNNPTHYQKGVANDDKMLENMKAMIHGGGHYASRVDLLRRGLYFKPGEGSSVAADFNVGGGVGMFTRILKKGDENNWQDLSGLFWKPRVVKRLDAVSYSGDEFGEMREGVQQNKRRRNLSELSDVRHATSNETIFRDTLSLFDDFDKMVFNKKSTAEEMRAFMRAEGYKEWPDGRKLEEVIRYKGQK